MTEFKPDPSLRDTVRVRMTQEAYRNLRNLLALTYNRNILAQYPGVADFMRQATSDFLDLPGPLIQTARDYHGTSEEEVEVDEDAALSRTDLGCWVQGWLWVPSDED